MDNKKSSQLWQITCNKSQLKLIAKALENYSRRLGGQFSRYEDIVIRDLAEKRVTANTEDNFDYRKFCEELQETLTNLKKLLFPEFPDGSGSYGFDHTPEIGNSYQIYRTIYHELSKENNDNSVYRRPPLPSGTLGSIKVEKLKKDYGKEQ